MKRNIIIISLPFIYLQPPTGSPHCSKDSETNRGRIYQPTVKHVETFSLNFREKLMKEQSLCNQFYTNIKFWSCFCFSEAFVLVMCWCLSF